MISKKKVYWFLQFFGWITLFSIGLVNRNINLFLIQNVLVFALFGIILSHLLRFVILKSGMLNRSYLILVVQSFVLALTFALFFVALRHLYLLVLSNSEFDIQLIELLNIAVYFFVWQFFYLGYGLVEKNRKEELNNLKLIALNNEIELRNLKTQLNPHFMFNALNSVRALIDEDTSKAKESVLLVSNILRAALQSDKKELSTIKEEIELVKDYLSIEKIRFEDRLIYSFLIDDNTLNMSIPPFIIQTLVENGIKHGISKRIQQGEISIKVTLENEMLFVQVINDIAQSNKSVESTGIGISNLKKRLEIIYNNKASFSFELNEKAIATLKIPQKL